MKKPMFDQTAFDSEFPAEQSAVRARQNGDVARVRDESVGERNARIDALIREAEHLLTRLAPTDHRLRLLCSAILRRDETLLDAILTAHARSSDRNT